MSIRLASLMLGSIVLLVSQVTHADDSCEKYAKNWDDVTLKKVDADEKRLKEGGFPDCLSASACFVFHKDATWHVDVGILIKNACAKNVDVRVFVPKKIKRTNEPDPKSIESKDRKDKYSNGATIKKGKAYVIGTLTYSREFPVEAILLELKPN